MNNINLSTLDIPSEFGRKFKIISNLDDGASLRKYWHLSSEKENLILSYQGENLENYIKFSKIYAEFNIAVPELFWIDFQNKLILMEYIEQDCHLLHQKDAIITYHPFVQDLILKIQSIPNNFFPRSFKEEKFNSEWNDLIVQKIVGAENIRLWNEHIYVHLIDVFKQSEKPGHRDLQSSNLFLKNDILYLIDFQDSMFIHPLYDIASYFWDSYIEVNFDVRFKLAHDASGKILKNFNEHDLLWVLLQRKLHDIGAFIRAVENGKSNFVNYIKYTVSMCNWIISELNMKLDTEKLWKNSLIQKY